MKKLVITACAVVALLVLTANAALADTCRNLSRPAPSDPSAPIVKGNWHWVPDDGIWMFAVPGGADSMMFGTPDAGGNYTNGRTGSLLGVSNNCPVGNNPYRQTTNGIQSLCE